MDKTNGRAALKKTMTIYTTTISGDQAPVQSEQWREKQTEFSGIKKIVKPFTFPAQP
jgi:hypothetical protein